MPVAFAAAGEERIEDQQPRADRDRGIGKVESRPVPSGGVEVEGLKDFAFALAPATLEEAKHLLESTWAGRKLRGYRNIPPADYDSVIDILLRLAQLAAECPELAEIEINPLKVLEGGRGALALDVRASYRS